LKKVLKPLGAVVGARVLAARPGSESGPKARFRRALLAGIRPDDRRHRYPIVPFRILDDQELSAICASLRSVPAVPNAAPAPEASVIDATDRGQRIFYKYAPLAGDARTLAAEGR
jgi:hypothetical protein